MSPPSPIKSARPPIPTTIQISSLVDVQLSKYSLTFEEEHLDYNRCRLQHEAVGVTRCHPPGVAAQSEVHITVGLQEGLAAGVDFHVLRSVHRAFTAGGDMDVAAGHAAGFAEEQDRGVATGVDLGSTIGDDQAGVHVVGTTVYLENFLHEKTFHVQA